MWETEFLESNAKKNENSILVEKIWKTPHSREDGKEKKTSVVDRSCNHRVDVLVLVLVTEENCLNWNDCSGV